MEGVHNLPNKFLNGIIVGYVTIGALATLILGVATLLVILPMCGLSIFFLIDNDELDDESMEVGVYARCSIEILVCLGMILFVDSEFIQWAMLAFILLAVHIADRSISQGLTYRKNAILSVMHLWGLTLFLMLYGLFLSSEFSLFMFLMALVTTLPLLVLIATDHILNHQARIYLAPENQ